MITDRIGLASETTWRERYVDPVSFKLAGADFCKWLITQPAMKPARLPAGDSNECRRPLRRSVVRL